MQKPGPPPLPPPAPTPSPLWNQKQESKLLFLVETLDSDWTRISNCFPLFCESDCQTKMAAIIAKRLQVAWSLSEDEQLSEIINKSAEVNWFDCSSRIQTRSPDACRRRWSQLRPLQDRVGDWGHLEQVAIFRFVREKEFSWKKVIELLPGRSQNAVKSFFHSTVRRLKKSSLFEFLKKMTTWPTYTNRSNFSRVF